MPMTERTRGRPAVGVETPALTRHLIVFFPARTAKSRSVDSPPESGGIVEKPPGQSLPPDDDPLAPKAAKELLTRYATSLLKIAVKSGALAESELSDELEKIKRAIESRSNFTIYCGTFLTFRLRIIGIMYAEHFTLTYILDNYKIENKFKLFSSQYLDKISDLSIYLYNILKTHPNGNASGDVGTSAYHAIPVSAEYTPSLPPSLNPIIMK